MQGGHLHLLKHPKNALIISVLSFMYVMIEEGFFGILPNRNTTGASVLELGQLW